MFLPLSPSIPKMTAAGYSNQIATSAATRDHDHGSLLSPHDKIENGPAIQPLSNSFVDTAAVSQAVHKLDRKIPLPRAANPASRTNSDEIPQQNTQQQHVPVVVSKAQEQEGKTTPAIQDTTAPAIKAENIEPISPTVTKARHDNLAMTSSMEAYANDAAARPIIDSTDTSRTGSPPLEYHNTDSKSAATRLKRRLQETDELVVCPGVYDGFSARIAISVGFSALYMVLYSRLSSAFQNIKIPWTERYLDRCRHNSFSSRYGRFRCRSAP